MRGITVATSTFYIQSLFHVLDHLSYERKAAEYLLPSFTTTPITTKWINMFLPLLNLLCSE